MKMSIKTVLLAIALEITVGSVLIAQVNPLGSQPILNPTTTTVTPTPVPTQNTATNVSPVVPGTGVVPGSNPAVPSQAGNPVMVQSNAPVGTVPGNSSSTVNVSISSSSSVYVAPIPPDPHQDSMINDFSDPIDDIIKSATKSPDDPCIYQLSLKAQDDGKYPVGLFAPHVDGKFSLVVPSGYENIRIDMWRDENWRMNIVSIVKEFNIRSLREKKPEDLARAWLAVKWIGMGVPPTYRGMNGDQKSIFKKTMRNHGLVLGLSWRRRRRFDLFYERAKQLFAPYKNTDNNPSTNAPSCFDEYINSGHKMISGSSCGNIPADSYETKKNFIYQVRATDYKNEFASSREVLLKFYDCSCNQIEYIDSHLQASSASPRIVWEKSAFDLFCSGAENYKFEVTPDFAGSVAFYQSQDASNSVPPIAYKQFDANQPISLMLENVPECSPIKMVIEYESGRAGNFQALVSEVQNK